MNTAALNLARKWRSQSFDTVVGQELVVRLLKNSLYRDMLMPVYLLAGMRGCGKTSIGRLFAAALNCAELETFRKQPQETSLPCWNCLSCRAIQKSQHPDFIEIDAASHTGVDNIRNLIDIASFVPALGTKKIYLIDEAHMLSKAAFNALLKILEEPPVSVVFMLATTDSHKIPDTVRSRCFQLFFKPIVSVELVKHLEFICAKEQINYDTGGLELVAQESEGSVRDALNLIERVRLSHEAITQSTLVQVLGFLDDEKLVTIFEAFLHKDPAAVLELCSNYHLNKYNMQILWKKLILLFRTALLIKHKLPVDNFASLQDKISHAIQTISVARLVASLELCYTHELSFTRTALPYPLFEMLLVKLAVLGAAPVASASPRIERADSATELKKKLALTEIQVSFEHGPAAATTPDAARVTHKNISALESVDARWEKFMQLLESDEDHMINALFKQSRFIRFSAEKKQVDIEFSQSHELFKDMFQERKLAWQSHLITAFGTEIICNMQFTGPVVPASETKSRAQAGAASGTSGAAATIVNGESKAQQDRPATGGSSTGSWSKAGAAGAPKYTRQNYESKPKEVAISISDSEKWPKASLLTKIFPGTLTQVKT